MRALLLALLVGCAVAQGIYTDIWMTNGRCSGTPDMSARIYDANQCFKDAKNPVMAGARMTCPAKSACGQYQIFFSPTCTGQNFSDWVPLADTCTYNPLLQSFASMTYAKDKKTVTVKLACDAKCSKCNTTTTVARSTTGCQKLQLMGISAGLRFPAVEESCSRTFIRTESFNFKTPSADKMPRCAPATSGSNPIGDAMVSFAVDGLCLSTGNMSMRQTCTPPAVTSTPFVYLSTFTDGNCTGKAKLTAAVRGGVCVEGNALACPTKDRTESCAALAKWQDGNCGVKSPRSPLLIPCGICEGDENGFRTLTCDTQNKRVTMNEACDSKCANCKNVSIVTMTGCAKRKVSTTEGFRLLKLGEKCGKFVQMDHWPRLAANAQGCQPIPGQVGDKRTSLAPLDACDFGKQISCTRPKDLI